MEKLQLRLDGGHEAEVLWTDGVSARLRASRALPPGATLRGAVAETGSLELKVKACRRTGDGELPYVIEGRWVNLTRPQLLLLTEREP